MPSTLPESHQLARDSAREFAEKRLKPLAEQIEASQSLPPELFRQMGELGLLGLAIPEEYGGTGQGFLAATLAMEELAKASGAVALSFGAHSCLCAYNLFAHANEEQRRRYLPGLVSGRDIGAFALTEPGSGSDAASMQTRAVFKDGRYLLNGTKIFITNGSMARVFLVFARTERRRGRGALSAFVVERGFKGFSTGRDIKKLGTCGSPLTELIFKDCEVPAQNLLGEEGRGLAYMLKGLDMERSVFSGMAVGLAQAALDYALDYAAQRRQFGAPLTSFQLVQEMLADTATELEAARLLTYQAAEMLDRGQSVTKQASFAKLYAARMAVRATQAAVQILGGYGYTRECPVERFYRDAMLVGIGGGTSQIQQLIIARELVKERARR
ncbi:MAG: acyl-CoA dehydrogenase family protein [Elusimicrobiota bacterium]